MTCMRLALLSACTLSLHALPAMDLGQANAWWGPMGPLFSDEHLHWYVQPLVFTEPALRIDEGMRVQRRESMPADVHMVVAWDQSAHVDNRTRAGVRIATDRADSDAGRPCVAAFASLNSIAASITSEVGWSEARGVSFDAVGEVIIFDAHVHADERMSWYGVGQSLRVASGGAPYAVGGEWALMNINVNNGDSLNAFHMSAWGSYVVSEPILVTAGVDWYSRTVGQDGRADRSHIAAVFGVGLSW